MDSVTQAALGALCGELVLRKKLGNWGIVWGLFFGTLPDLDVLASPWLDTAGKLAFHRGVSHSFLLMLVGGLIFGWLLKRLHRKSALTWWEGGWFVFLAWSTHVLIDCFTVYGTQILAPFNDLRASLDNLFIIDLFFTVPILVGLVAVMFMAREGRRRRLWGIAVVSWLLCYTAMSFGMQAWAKSEFERRLAADAIEVERIQVTATLSNIVLWRMVAETEEHYYVGYWTPWDGPKNRSWAKVEKRHDLIADLQGGREFETVEWFSKGWFIARPSKDGVTVADMRFGEIRVQEGEQTYLMPTFRWNLVGEGQDARISDEGSGRPDVDMGPVLKGFWERLKGGAPGYMDGEWR